MKLLPSDNLVVSGGQSCSPGPSVSRIGLLRGARCDTDVIRPLILPLFGGRFALARALDDLQETVLGKPSQGLGELHFRRVVGDQPLLLEALEDVTTGYFSVAQHEQSCIAGRATRIGDERGLRHEKAPVQQPLTVVLAMDCANLGARVRAQSRS